MNLYTIYYGTEEVQVMGDYMKIGVFTRIYKDNKLKAIVPQNALIVIE